MRKFLSVLLAVMMVLSTVSFAAPSAFKPIDAVVETPVAEVPADDAELAIGYTDNAPYGDLVFELDFDNLENGTTIANNAMLKELGATLNPDYPKTDELFLVLSQYGSAVVENGVLKAVKTGTGRWPQIQVSVQNKNSFVDSGVIYMEADMMVDLADTQTASVNLGLTGYREYLDGERDAGSSMQASVKTLYNVEDEKWYTLNGHYALNDEDEALGLQCLIMLPTYSASSSETDYFYVDSIRLYYKPFEANVTVNAGGKTGTAKVSTGYPVKLDDLYSAVGASPLYTASGVYVGEEYYTAEDTFYIVEDTEVELELAPVDSQYYTGEYGLQLFNFTFEEETVGAQITDDANTTPAKLIEAYQTPFTDKLFTHPAENWVVMANTGKTFVKADPTNPENTVLATEDITSSGYPVIRVDTWVDYMKKHKWGFVESEEGIFTAVYDVWNKSGDLNFTERFGGLSANVIDADGYYKEKEEVGTETETKVAEQWRTNVTTFSPSNIITNETLSSTTEVSYLKIHAVMPNADTYYMDNIRLYWKPLKADVGFDTNGFDVHITNTTVADVDTTGVLVSDLLDAAGVEYDAARYVFKGLSLDPEGRTGVYTANQKMPLPADCILYFVMEEVELEDNPWYDENGIVLFEIDFDNAEAASVFTATTNNKDHWLKDFAKVNPNIAGSDKWALSTSGMDVVGIENGALKLQWDGSGKWPQVLIGNPTNEVQNVMMGTHGRYHVHAEYKILDAVDADLASISVTANGVVDGVHKSASGILPMGYGFYKNNNQLVANQWLTIDGGKSTKDNDTDGLDNDDINKITTVFTYNNTASAGGYYLIDNIKLSWKPETVNLTVYGGSNPGYATKTTLKNVPTSATVADVVAMLPGSDYGLITGFADMNGNKLDSLNLISNSSLVAVWAPYVVIEGGQEFPIDAQSINSGNSGQWDAGYGYKGDIGDGGDTTTAIHISYNRGWYSTGGNMYKVVRAPHIGDVDSGELGETTAQGWTIPAIRGDVDQNSLMRDNIVTNLAENNDAEYVLVRYRYNNVPDLKALAANCPNPDGYKYTVSEDGLSLTYRDRYGESATAVLNPAYGSKLYIQCQDGSYQYGGGEEFHKNEVMVDGKWIYDLLPVNDTMKAKGVKKVIIQRKNLFDGMVVEYDYVRFVKGGEDEEVVLPDLGGSVKIKAPTTVETAEARISDDQYGNGLRFKASVLQKTAEVTEDLGWIVTTQAYCYNNIGTEEDLTLAAETDVNDPKVKVAYQIKDGEAQANFYGGTDEEPVFSAVLYGIPLEHMYDLIVVRPFAKAGTSEKYGDPVVTSLFDTAIAPYIVLSEDYDYVRDLAMINESLEEAFDYGDIAYADAYYDLSEEHKAYVDEMIAADFELGLEM